MGRTEFGPHANGKGFPMFASGACEGQPPSALYPRIRDSDAPIAARTVAELLRASLDMLPFHCEAARQHISRACAVLETVDAVSPSAGGEPTTSASGGLVSWQAKRVTAYIDANLGKPMTAKEISAVAHLGPSHFQRAFRRCFGMSPHAFVIERRIQKAQELMLTTDAPLCEIALAVGFSDQSHLTTRFHRATGATPSVWRRAMRDDHAERLGVTARAA
jgi:AraC family transcriptional regulator